MRRLGIVAALAGALVSAAPARAATIVTIGGQPIARYQRWVDAGHMPTAPGLVRVQFAAGRTAYGAEGRIIRVSTDQPLRQVDFMHEIGHDYEAHTVSDTGWQRWAAWTAMRLPRSAVDERFGFAEPVAREHFADWYAACATGGRWLVIGLSGRTVITQHGRVWKRAPFRRACRRAWQINEEED